MRILNRSLRPPNLPPARVRPRPRPPVHAVFQFPLATVVMRPSSAVHPREEDEEAPLDPEPPSRKARKYVDRKAPKVNFLRKVRCHFQPVCNDLVVFPASHLRLLRLLVRFWTMCPLGSRSRGFASCPAVGLLVKAPPCNILDPHCSSLPC